MSLNIIRKHIKFNYSKRTEKIKYIVIHDTGNTSKGANALAHFNFFNSGDKQSSAHYFVDDKQIIETVEPVNNKSWHCGDGKGRFGITNNNSIGIEMCVNSDGDFKSTFNRTIELVKHLQKIHNIPNDCVVSHYDASRKTCPFTLIKQKPFGLDWNQFKSKLNNNNKEILYRVCVGSYSNIENARKKAQEVGGFIVKYEK